MNSKEYAVIVAGGKGTRIKSETPKQFLEINGMPVLMHSILAFYRYSEKARIIVVLPDDEMDTWKSLCSRYSFSIPLTIQNGGKSRFQSVKNGLQAVDDDGIVAIHDGVRPCVGRNLIATSFQVAGINGTAVAAVPLKESLRMIQDNTTKSVDRSNFRLIQTPQTFQASIIKKAYERAEDSRLTDDASVAESAGFRITLFEGSYDNIKITTPEDLAVAETLLRIGQNAAEGIKR